MTDIFISQNSGYAFRETPEENLYDEKKDKSTFILLF